MPTDAEEILHDAVNQREALQLGDGARQQELNLTRGAQSFLEAEVPAEPSSGSAWTPICAKGRATSAPERATSVAAGGVGGRRKAVMRSSIDAGNAGRGPTICSRYTPIISS